MPTEQCSKCPDELDTDGFPKWCKKCRAKYQREYVSLRKEMSETRGFAAGCTAMRTFLAENFRQYGTTGMFSGAEIAAVIMNARGPEVTVSEAAASPRTA